MDAKIIAFLAQRRAISWALMAVVNGVLLAPISGDPVYIAGTYTSGAGVHEGFLWQASNGFTTVSVPGSIDTFTHGVNSSLEVSGYFDDAIGAHGYVRTLSGTFTIFDVPGASATYAYGLNNLGYVTGSYGSHGFIWQPGGGLITFDPPGSVGTDPAGINDSGAAVGFFLNSSLDFVNEGFVRKSDGSFTIFDVPGALDTYASGINNRGDITGSFDVASGGSQQGFILLSGTGPVSDRLVIVDVPGSSMTRAFGINDLDEVFGAYTLAGIRHGFVREPDGHFTTVDFPGSVADAAKGGGSPEPSAVYLSAVGIACLLLLQCRARLKRMSSNLRRG